MVSMRMDAGTGASGRVCSTLALAGRAGSGTGSSLASDRLRSPKAVFADTGWEPPSVYEHLDWLQEQLSFEVVRVSAGNIKDNILEGTSPDGNNYLGIPAFLINADGSTAVAARQCTSKYKVRPINR